MLKMAIAVMCLSIPGTLPADETDLVIDGLIRASDDESAAVRAAAIRALVAFETDQIAVFNAITAGFIDDHAEVRGAAVSAFRVLKGFEEEKAKFLLTMIKEADDDARQMAFGEISAYREELMEPLCQLLVSNMIEDAQRRSLLSLIIGWGPEAAPAVPSLVTLLRNYPDFRLQAIEALAGVGPAAKEAIPQLLRLLYDPDESTRLAVVTALPSIAGNEELFAATRPIADERVERIVTQLFSRYDENRDGVIAGAEFDGVRSAANLDINRDKRITRREVMQFYDRSFRRAQTGDRPPPPPRSP